MTAAPKKTRRSPGEEGCYSYRTGAGERWRVKCVTVTPDGARKEVDKRGFATKREAQAALRDTLAASDHGGHAEPPSRQLTGAYLTDWTDGLRLALSTVAGYRR